MLVAMTGASGFVGSHTLRALADRGHTVRALVRDRAKFERLLAARGLAQPEIVEGDMTDRASVAALVEGAESVIHTAATVAFEPGLIERMHANNVAGVENVVTAALEAGARSIVYTSSVAAIFHGGYPPITIDDPVAEPDNPYGKAKADAERAARSLQERSDGRLSILYPPGIIGPDDPALSESNKAFLIYIRDWAPRTTGGMSLVDVRDVAEILVAVAERGGDGRYLFAGLQLAWEEIACVIERVTRRAVKRKLLPGPLLRGAGRLFDAMKTVAPLDFPLTLETMTYATRWPGIVTSPAAATLEHQYRTAEQTIGDLARWLEHEGHIDKKARGALPPWPVRAG